jgi:hypothetical protein
VSRLAGFVVALIGLVACAAPGTPTKAPSTPTITPGPSPTASAPASARPSASSTGVAGTFISGTIIFVGDTISPIVFDGVYCSGAANYGAIHKGAHLTFIDADSGSTKTPAGDAVLDVGTPAGNDCKFTWSGYLLPAQHYVVSLGDMHEWRLPAPLEVPLFLTFKASQVGATASP